MLKGAGAKLLKPKLVAAMQHWRDDWRDEAYEKQSMSLTERLAYETTERKTLAEQLSKMTRDLEEARRAALDGRGLEAELQRQMEVRLEREKEKRIEHAKEMAIRRIGKQGLAKGWTAWVEPYLEAKRIERALKAAGTIAASNL